MIWIKGEYRSIRKVGMVGGKEGGRVGTLREQDSGWARRKQIFG